MSSVILHDRRIFLIKYDYDNVPVTGHWIYLSVYYAGNVENIAKLSR